MSSLKVAKAEELASPVLATTETYAADVGASLDGVLSVVPVPEGSSPTDYPATMNRQSGLVAHHRDEVKLQGKLYDRTFEKRKSIARQLNTTTQEMVSTFTGVRSVFFDHYPEEVHVALHLLDEVLKRRVEAMTQTENFLELFDAFDLQAVTPNEGKGHPNLDDRMTHLRGLYGKCKSLRKSFALMAKDTEAARKSLNDAYEEFLRVLRGVAGVHESWFRMAGFDDAANRMRVLIRKASKKKKEDLVTSPPSDDGATPPSDGASPPPDTPPVDPPSPSTPDPVPFDVDPNIITLA